MYGWMEILNKQAPVGLHSGVNNARTGLSSSSLSSTLTRPSSAAVERHGLLVGVGPTLLVPMKILLVSNGRIAFVSPVERRKPTTVYYHPQGITRPRSRGRAYSRAETRDECSRRCNVTSVNVGGFREGLKGVGRVAHLRESGECGRSRWPVSSSLNGNHGAKESYLDLELEVFRFMQQSSKPDAFPTRQDLILAGRTDLVMAIEEEGGWLAAGWEDGSNFDAIEDNTDGRRGVTRGSRRQGSKSKFKTRSLKESISKARKSSSKVSTVRIEEPAHGITEPLVGINVVREVANAVDDKDGRMKSNRGTRLNIEGEPQEVLPILERAQVPYKEKSTPRRRKSSRGPHHDEFQVMERIASLISFTEELKLNRSQIGYQRDDLSQDSARNDFSKGTIVGTMSRRIFPENGFPNVTMGEFPVENSLRDSRDTTVDVAALPKRKRKHRKEERAKIVKENSTDKVNGTSDWIHKTVDKREELMRETRSRSDENSFGASVGDDSDSMQNRIHILAARLADTRATLQLGREALWRTENEEEGQKRAMEELIDAEDTLEFRENAIMHARTELNTTRAQITALEGNMKVEIMEAQKVLDERNQQIERARAVYRKLRTTRIVWPNHGNKVFLTGSFDGWNRQIEMEKSSAGVFVVSLTLYPGRYEIKFVVDGSWRVDTNRPIVYVGGFENNVLMVS